MKAFISYSHKDENYLTRLKTHLAQIRRDGQLREWTDKDIYAGSQLDATISRELESSQLFIALLSPDYIASGYCYEKEFKKALEMQKQGAMIIVPVICEPCDWLNTPFSEFKALPKDGKPISDWQNANTAFLDIIFELRNILGSIGMAPDTAAINFPAVTGILNTKNYRVKKDFDSIQKMEFIDSAFTDVKELLDRYLKEIVILPDIKFRIVKDKESEFECILVNRNKINVESQLRFVKSYPKANHAAFASGVAELSASFKSDRSDEQLSFQLANNEYNLFWTRHDYFRRSEDKVCTVKDIADSIWEVWLSKVGVDLQ